MTAIFSACAMAYDTVTTLLNERQLQQRQSGFAVGTPTVAGYTDYLSKQSGQRCDVMTKSLGVVATLDYKPNVIGIPVVGFGGQSDVMRQTARCLMQTDPVQLKNTNIVFLVNRPDQQAADRTFADLAACCATWRQSGLQAAVADIALTAGVRMGDIRSGLFDGAVMRAMQQDRDITDLRLIATDDDNIAMSKDFVAAMTAPAAFQNPDSLVCANVSFDCTTNRNEAYPNFYYAERLRQTVAADKLRQLASISGNPDDNLNTVYGGARAGYIEPVVLSTFALSGRGFAAIGGYSPVDEITKTVRMVYAYNSLNGNAASGIKTADTTIVTSNRRQLQAYMRDNLPSAAGWKGSVKFKSDDVDPIRLQTVIDGPDRKKTLNTDELSKLYRITFDYMGVSNPSAMKAYVAAVNPDMPVRIGYYQKNKWCDGVGDDVKSWPQKPVFEFLKGAS